MSCISHLMMIGNALSQYHEVYGSFPPAYVADRAGKPAHSWRILILPYLDAKDVYDQYHFNEPWNSPNNRRLAKYMPKQYRCIADTGAKATTTSYVAVIGPHAAWPGAKSVSHSDVTDYGTIMVVEVSDSGIDWMEPRDLEVNEAVAGVNRGTKLGIRSHHDSFANCLFMDGSAHSLDSRISPQLLADLLRIDVSGKLKDSREPIRGTDYMNH